MSAVYQGSKQCSGCGSKVPLRVVTLWGVVVKYIICQTCDVRQCGKCKSYVKDPKAARCPNSNCKHWL